MEDETKKKVMKIQCAVKEELSTLGVLNKNDHRVITENESPTFMRPALFCCSKCDKRFTRADNWKTHERIHTGEKPFSCSKCDKKFTNSCNLKTHERIHNDERPFSCSQCKKAFRDSGNLKKHKRIHID